MYRLWPTNLPRIEFSEFILSFGGLIFSGVYFLKVVLSGLHTLPPRTPSPNGTIMWTKTLVGRINMFSEVSFSNLPFSPFLVDTIIKFYSVCSLSISNHLPPCLSHVSHQPCLFVVPSRGVKNYLRPINIKLITLIPEKKYWSLSYQPLNTPPSPLSPSSAPKWAKGPEHGGPLGGGPEY